MSEELIEKTAEETAKKVVLELKKQGMLKDDRQTPFQKTETLLYNYNNFLEAIRDRELQIEELKKNVVNMKSKSITSFSTQPRYDFTNASEEKADEIAKIEGSIRVTRNFVSTIESALEVVNKDSYYGIIEMKYFEGKSREEIAEHYGKDVKTITRNKNRLVNQLQIRLFSDEYIEKIFS